jgi:hypothetical protein
MQWISIKDRLPACDKEVLCTEGENVFIGRLEDIGWSGYDFMSCDVTHWMPIPKPPKD